MWESKLSKLLCIEIVAGCYRKFRVQNFKILIWKVHPKCAKKWDRLLDYIDPILGVRDMPKTPFFGPKMRLSLWMDNRETPISPYYLSSIKNKELLSQLQCQWVAVRTPACLPWERHILPLPDTFARF